MWKKQLNLFLHALNAFAFHNMPINGTSILWFIVYISLTTIYPVMPLLLAIISWIFTRLGGTKKLKYHNIHFHKTTCEWTLSWYIELSKIPLSLKFHFLTKFSLFKDDVCVFHRAKLITDHWTRMSTEIV